MPTPEHLESSLTGGLSGEAASQAPSPAHHLAASLSRLEQAVTEIHGSAAFRRYLDAQARFHHYSWGNVLLILAQKPEATQVAGYRTWQALGRRVRKGERGIRILIPLRRGQVSVADQDGDDATTRAASRPLAFGTAAVFDLSQTEGDPLPVVDVPVLVGEDGQALYDRLRIVAEHEGLQVRRGSERFRSASTLGFYDPAQRLITVREAAPLQMTKTLAHELAHHYDGTQRSDEVSESLAESVAYVVCAHFDLETGERSFPYVAAWSLKPAVLRGLLTRIQRISGQLIDQVEAQADTSKEL
jgi:antirestriction protein ArdC